MCGCHLHARYWGPGLQPMHACRLRIKLETLWFAGQHAITPARVWLFFFFFDQRMVVRFIHVVVISYKSFTFIAIYYSTVSLSHNLCIYSAIDRWLGNFYFWAIKNSAVERHIQQWNRVKSPRINSLIYGQMIFDKSAKTIQWRKDSLFNKWCWENWISTLKRMELDPYLAPYRKI